MKLTFRNLNYSMLLIGAFLMFASSCTEDVDPTAPVPVLETSEVTMITSSTASCGGTIFFDAGSTITARGVCWSTGTTPTIADSKTIDGSGSGAFLSSLTGLTVGINGTMYYVRAYATTNAGTYYGSAMSFTSLPGGSAGTVKDIDGNVYQTIIIGTQVWMVENLKTTKYRDGSLIPNVTDNTSWRNLRTGAYCNYNNDAAIGAKYGKLYNWYAMHDSRNIAPTGWHVPTSEEWTTLQNYVLAHLYSGSWAKVLASTTDWASSTITGQVGNDLTKNNTTGFTALPGGERYDTGTFYGIGDSGWWWSSTEAGAGWGYFRGLRYDSYAPSNGFCYTEYGCSIRCLRD